MLIRERERLSQTENFYRLTLELDELRGCDTILELCGYIQSEKYLFLVSDGRIETTLDDLIPHLLPDEGMKIPRPPDMVCIKLMDGIVDACVHLHRAGILHKDIRR